jgi:hypothetical protein
MAQKKTETEFHDIFNGELVNVWEDGDMVYISFPYCTLDVPKEVWPEIKKDLDKLAEL